MLCNNEETKLQFFHAELQLTIENISSSWQLLYFLMRFNQNWFTEVSVSILSGLGAALHYSNFKKAQTYMQLAIFISQIPSS